MAQGWERDASQKEEKNPTEAAGRDVFYILLTNGDEFVEKWEGKGKVFLDFLQVGNCGAVTIWGHGWWKGLFRKVCLCGFFSVPSLSLVVRWSPLLPPTAATQPFPAWRERGAPRRGFLPCFHPTGRRQGIILCLLSLNAFCSE